MKGFRTIFFGLAVAIGPAAATYLGGIDWTKLGVSPSVAAVIGALIVGLRAITTTPPGKGS